MILGTVQIKVKQRGISVLVQFDYSFPQRRKAAKRIDGSRSVSLISLRLLALREQDILKLHQYRHFQSLLTPRVSML